MTSMIMRASANLSRASAERACENTTPHWHETEKQKREVALSLTPISQSKTVWLKACAGEAGSRRAPPSPAKRHVRNLLGHKLKAPEHVAP